MPLATAGTRRPWRTAAAAAEMAVVLPLLVFLFVMAVDFARAFSCSQVIATCAHNGAMYASGNAKRLLLVSAESAAKNAAVAEGANLSPPLKDTDVAVTITKELATVTVTYEFSTFSRFPGLPGTVTIRRAVTMRVAPKVGVLGLGLGL
jgi:hypothetical protein